MQTRFRDYRKRKLEWTAYLTGELLTEVQRLRDFINKMPIDQQVQKYGEMKKELTLLESEHKIYVKNVATSIINYYKDIQVLNMYRYNFEILGK